MKDIKVSKRSLILTSLLAVVTAGMIFAAERWLLQREAPQVTPAAQDDLAAAAAVSGVQEIYTLDYQAGREEWLARICAVSTPAGCQLFTTGADMIWAGYLENSTVVEAEVTPVEKSVESASEQVWLVSIKLSAALPGNSKIEDTDYAVVVWTQEGWKFDRFLLDEEIDAIHDRPALSTPTAKKGR